MEAFGTLLFTLFLTIGVPVGLFVITCILGFIIILLLSIPILICHWLYESLKKVENT